MSKALIEDLSSLRNSLVDKIQELKNSNFDDNFASINNGGEKSGQNCADSINCMMIKYEAIIKSLVVILNNEYRGFRIKWQKSVDFNGADDLRIIEFDNEYMVGNVKQELLAIINQFVCDVDWFSEFKIDFRNIIKALYDKNLSEIDKKRESIIKSHMVEEGEDIHDDETGSGKSVTGDHSRKKKSWTFEDKGVTAKNKLLNTTKKITNNLIKGNQVLQSSVLQSNLNLDELKQQTLSMQKMNDKYMQFEVVFNKTSALVKKLEKASHQEKRDVYLSLGFLAICISWVLWRRIFKLPVKIGLWLTFQFFKSILVSIGFIKKVTTSHSNVISSTIISNTITSITKTASIDKQKSIEQAVDAAMERIMEHDEL